MSNQTIVVNSDSEISNYLQSLEDKLGQTKNEEIEACGNLEIAEMNLGNCEVELECVTSIWKMISKTSENAKKVKSLLESSTNLSRKIAVGGDCASEAFKLLVICAEELAEEVTCIKSDIDHVVQSLKAHSPKLDEGAAIFKTLLDVQLAIDEAQKAALETISKTLDLYADGMLLTQKLGDYNCSFGITNNVYDLHKIVLKCSDSYHDTIKADWETAKNDLTQKQGALEVNQEEKSLASAKLNAINDAYISAIAANAC